MKKKIFLFAIVCFILLLTLGETQRASAQGPGVRGPFVGTPVRAFSFDGDVRGLPQPRLPASDEIREAPRPRPKAKQSFQPKQSMTSSDPARQTSRGSLSMPSPSTNFDGLGATGWIPPDTNGDVGPNHYIQTVNKTIGIYNKDGTLGAGPFTFDSFFSGASSPCNSGNQGDPVVLYDALADRWVITDFAFSSFGPFYESIAVSKTGNPVSGGWWLYCFPAHTTLLNDYPKLGVWPDAYYMSANLFNSLDQFQGVRVWALDRVSMQSGTLNSVFFDVSSSYSSLLPSNLRGTAPPANTPNFFVSIDVPSTNTIHLWKFHVDWLVPALSTFTGPTNLTVASFIEPTTDVPEMGGNPLDTLGDRLMMQLQYRNIGGTESLWATHSVNSGGVIGLRWYEMRNPNGSPSVYQQGTYQPDSLYRWMPSLAVDNNGNMAIGYSVSSSGMFPAIRYAGRVFNDPLNALCQGETTLIAGGGAQTGICGGGICTRWGDYSAMTVDPNDDLTFWYTNEYYQTTGGGWKTRIGSFKFPELGGGSLPRPFAYYFPFVSKSFSSC